MARYGVTYEGVDEPAPADPAQRIAQAEANLRIAMAVLRRDDSLVEYLSDRLLAIAASVPDRVEGFNLGGRGAELFADPRLTDFRSYPPELYRAPGERLPNRAAQVATRTRFRDRRRRAAKVVRRVSHVLSGRGSRDAVEQCTRELRDLGRTTLRQAVDVVRNASRALSSRARPGAHLVRQLIATIANAERVVAQTTTRLGGERVIPDRVVSLSDTDARPIRRGKPQRMTEFGYKVSVADTPEGFVVAQVYKGNPSDAQTLETAVAAAQAVGIKIRSVAADRGYGDIVGDRALAARGITDKVIPRKGQAVPVERTRNWRRRYRWRAGSEGRISCLSMKRAWASRG
jgi:hypothetical protein